MEEDNVAEYIIKRLLQGILIVLAVSVILFAIMQMMPGDPIMLICGDRVSEEVQLKVRQEWGLDQPVYVQYWRWLSHALQGDFGQSIITGQDTIQLIMTRLPYTLLLSGLALLLQYIIGVPIGLLAAYKRNSIFDRAVVWISTILWSIPGYWLSVLLVLCFSVSLSLLRYPAFPVRNPSSCRCAPSCFPDWPPSSEWPGPMHSKCFRRKWSSRPMPRA